MKSVLLTAALVGALTSCGQLAGKVVDRLYPDGLPLATLAVSLPTGATAEGQVYYLQFDVFEGVDTVIHSVMKEWTAPQFLGDSAYVTRGGTVTSIDLYLRPNLDGCAAVQMSGVPAFLCPLAGEDGHRLGSINVSGSLQNWGPLASPTLRQTVQARKGYLGLRVTSGQVATGDELRATVKIKPG